MMSENRLEGQQTIFTPEELEQLSAAHREKVNTLVMRVQFDMRKLDEETKARRNAILDRFHFELTRLKQVIASGAHDE